MWDLPGPELEPVSPASAGGFLTTAPPGKPLRDDFDDKTDNVLYTRPAAQPGFMFAGAGKPLRNKSTLILFFLFFFWSLWDSSLKLFEHLFCFPT